jgi:hypothetical protein
MSFRRPESDAHAHQRQWGEWIAAHRAELAAMGLPPEVYLDEARWDDFLQNGGLDWHEGTGWSFADLTTDEMRALRRFLNQHFANDSRCRHLIGFLAERLKNPEG